MCIVELNNKHPSINVLPVVIQHHVPSSLLYAEDIIIETQ